VEKEDKMSVWVQVILGLGLVTIFTLVFSGHAMFSPENSVYLPETVTRVEPTFMESYVSENSSLKSDFLGDGLVYIPDVGGQRDLTFANPATAGPRNRSHDRNREELEIPIFLRGNASREERGQ
jgi:hypothetical protein